MACRPSDCVRGASFKHADDAGSGATELAIRPKDKLPRGLEPVVATPPADAKTLVRSPKAGAGSVISLVEKGRRHRDLPHERRIYLAVSDTVCLGAERWV